MDIQAIEQYLFDHIPISKALGVKVLEVTSDQVILFGEFLNNINHKKTAFGGSLHAIATLSCWTFLFSRLHHITSEIVIMKSTVTFQHSVTRDFQVKAFLSNSSRWYQFEKVLKAKGKSKISLRAQIFQNEKPAVEFDGVFAAFQ